MFTKARYGLSTFAEALVNYSPKSEVVLLVNESNERIGSTTRELMRRDKMLHRSTYIYILNSEEKFYVQKRTESKDVYPGFYDVATGGVVLFEDQNDLESAKRELEEEMGIKGSDVEFCFNYYFAEGPVWCAVYISRWDKELVLQPEEVQWVELMSAKEVFERAKYENFTPDSVEILKILCDQQKIIYS